MKLININNSKEKIIIDIDVNRKKKMKENTNLTFDHCKTCNMQPKHVALNIFPAQITMCSKILKKMNLGAHIIKFLIFFN